MGQEYIEEKTFDKIDFTQNPLTKGEFESCTFISCDFSNSDLTAAAFIDCEFENCNLSMAKLNNTALREVRFTNCKMLGLHFENCNEIGLSASFDNSILEKTDFRTSFNYSIDPEKNRIRKARFSMTGIRGLLEKYDIEIDNQ